MTSRRGISGAKLSYLRKREAVHQQLRRETSQKRFTLLPRPARKPAGAGAGRAG